MPFGFYFQVIYYFRCDCSCAKRAKFKQKEKSGRMVTASSSPSFLTVKFVFHYLIFSITHPKRQKRFTEKRKNSCQMAKIRKDLRKMLKEVQFFCKISVNSGDKLIKNVRNRCKGTAAVAEHGECASLKNWWSFPELHQGSKQPFLRLAKSTGGKRLWSSRPRRAPLFLAKGNSHKDL